MSESPTTVSTAAVPRLGTVVVVGGSVAGLLAAAALTPHSDRVVVVERDHLPHGATARGGTPQATHTHGLLASGRMAMESLVPGLTDELIARGADSAVTWGAARPGGSAAA